MPTLQISQEKQAEMSVYDMAKFIFQSLKEKERRESPYDESKDAQKVAIYLTHMVGKETATADDLHPHTIMKFYEGLCLLQKRGLVMSKPRSVKTLGLAPVSKNNRDLVLTGLTGDYILTSLGYESDFNENGDILILDDAEKRVQSIYSEVPNFDSVVADYYRESIRAWQEGLLLSACICIGAASEGTIHALAKTVDACDKNFDIKKWQRSDMESKISNLVKKVDGLRRQHFPDVLSFKDIKTKLRNLADWFRITRNDAGHPDRDSPFPERKEVELSICQFRRYVISIFQIIHLLKPFTI